MSSSRSFERSCRWTNRKSTGPNQGTSGVACTEEDLVIITTTTTTTTGRGDIPGEEGVTFTASITTRRRRAREDGNASPFRRLLFNNRRRG